MFVITALSTESWAVPFRPAEGEMFSIHSDLRFRCARVNGEWVFGKFTETKGTFKTFAAEKRSLQAKIAKATGKALTRLRRDLKAMKIAKKEVGDGCSAGPTPEESADSYQTGSEASG